MTRLKWFVLQFLRHYRNMGLRVVLYALAALLLAFVGPLGARILDDALPFDITFESVMPVLTILASSMLAVSTFSLNVMVTAHRAAAAATTPRVHRILLEDTTTQSVLATFLGAFVYSLTSIILYRSGFYTDQAAVLVMGVTIVVVVLVVVSLLRWIGHLKDLGSVDESLRLTKARAEETLTSFAEYPGFGARLLTGDVVASQGFTVLPAPCSGYLQLIDIAGLQDCLPDGCAIYVLHPPGAHVLEGTKLAEIGGHLSASQIAALDDCFTFGSHRTYEQDTAFGLTVLAETAVRALSPGVNDPGTALQVIAELKDLLWSYSRHPRADDAEQAETVYVRFPTDANLVDAAFAAIARDGAGTLEVAKGLRNTLLALAASDAATLSDAASDMSERAMGYAEASSLLDWELEALGRTTAQE